jgi:glycosyltransferase involved in cell wall biosynthesis
MQKKVASQLNHIVTVSERSYTDIIESFDLNSDNIQLIYNGIDTKEFKPLDNIERDRWQIMATASADQPLKGLRFLLLAFAQLVKKYPELHLVLVSQPKQGGETEKLVKQLGIGDKIQFVHGISTAVMVEHYARSSIAVVPSIYEGFGLPAGEAMACGVPVIATDGGALPEVVGQAGLTVPVKDADAIAAAIEKLLSNPKAREQYGQLGRKRIENNFSWQLVAEQMSALYQQILSADTVTPQQVKVEHANS